MTDAGLSGKRVLVVEDEYFIAAEVKRLFAQQDAAVTVAADARAGLAAAEQGEFDLGILDVNLGDGFSYPIADRLRTRGVPVLLLTGYDGWSLPSPYRALARLSKPFSDDALLATAARLCVGERAE